MSQKCLCCGEAVKRIGHEGRATQRDGRIEGISSQRIFHHRTPFRVTQCAAHHLTTYHCYHCMPLWLTILFPFLALTSTVLYLHLQPHLNLPLLSPPLLPFMSSSSPPVSSSSSAPLSSWVPVPEGSDFPIQNLPYGVFTTASQPEKHIGVAIGDHVRPPSTEPSPPLHQPALNTHPNSTHPSSPLPSLPSLSLASQVLDLHVLAKAGLFPSPSLHHGAVFQHPTLNSFMALERPQWLEARAIITSLLSSTTPTLRDDSSLRSHALLPLSSITPHLPFLIGDYTDFYAGRNHAFNVGSMWRGPANALQPNYLHLPVGYHGRSSSVVLSGTPIHRPRGQTLAEGETDPHLTPCKALDIELEVGVVVGGKANALGHPLTMKRARDRLFGLVLLNDWSARDIQKWEYVPLGPFTAKNFATSISPWVVTFDALAPFICTPPTQEPTPLPYLVSPSNEHYDIGLTVHLTAPSASASTPLSSTSTSQLYWTFQQLLTHHSVTGCPMNAGDLLGSGTISGEGEGAYGSMLEMSWGGKREVKLEGGEVRKYLHDGDEVVFRGRAKREGVGYEIGFGECRGKILPVVEDKDWE